jgi:hypothetical protein
MHDGKKVAIFGMRNINQMLTIDNVEQAVEDNSEDSVHGAKFIHHE